MLFYVICAYPTVTSPWALDSLYAASCIKYQNETQCAVGAPQAWCAPPASPWTSADDASHCWQPWTNDSSTSSPSIQQIDCITKFGVPPQCIDGADILKPCTSSKHKDGGAPTLWPFWPARWPALSRMCYQDLKKSEASTCDPLYPSRASHIMSWVWAAVKFWPLKSMSWVFNYVVGGGRSLFFVGIQI